MNVAAFQQLAFQCKALGLPVPVPELKFALPRRFAFDAAWVADKLALEIDGGVFVNGRHTRGAGYRKDCEKGALAAIRGWRVIHCLPEDIKSGKAVGWIEQALIQGGR